MNIEEIRGYFPYLKNDKTKNLAYLDNAATSQKPKQVLDRIYDYYIESNANPHRGAYSLSQESTALYEDTRKKLAEFIKADSEREIIFTKSTTESLNLVAYSYGLQNLKEGDEVLISVFEHHSNLVNWQYICEQTGASLRFFYMGDDYHLDIEDYKKKLNKNTKIVCVTAMSNVISSYIPIKEIVSLAKENGSITVVDGAQATAHIKTDVKEIGCDFYAFSGHKLFSPMGVGVLYGRLDLLQDMNPFLLGGDMIEYVHEDHTSYAEVPEKFEAGTQNVGGVVGLSAAIDFVEKIGFDEIEKREKILTEYCVQELRKLDFLDIYYPKEGAFGSNVTFNVKGVHPHDVASILDFEGVCIRSGHHCAQVLHRYLGINASCRASLAFYNTKEEIDKLVKALLKVKELMLGGA